MACGLSGRYLDEIEAILDSQEQLTSSAHTLHCFCTRNTANQLCCCKCGYVPDWEIQKTILIPSSIVIRSTDSSAVDQKYIPQPSSIVIRSTDSSAVIPQP